MNTPVLARLESKLRKRPLRDALNLIKSNPMPAKLKAALKAVQHCRDNETARAFFLWKLRTLSDKKDRVIFALEKKPRIVDGVSKLESLQNK